MKPLNLIIALGTTLLLDACALPPIDQNLEPIPLATALRRNTIAGGYPSDQNFDKSGFREFANAHLCPYWGLNNDVNPNGHINEEFDALCRAHSGRPDGNGFCLAGTDIKGEVLFYAHSQLATRYGAMCDGVGGSLQHPPSVMVVVQPKGDLEAADYMKRLHDLGYRTLDERVAERQEQAEREVSERQAAKAAAKEREEERKSYRASLKRGDEVCKLDGQGRWGAFVEDVLGDPGQWNGKLKLTVTYFWYVGYANGYTTYTPGNTQQHTIYDMASNWGICD